MSIIADRALQDTKEEIKHLRGVLESLEAERIGFVVELEDALRVEAKLIMLIKWDSNN